MSKGGTPTKKKEAIIEAQSVTCPNPSCGRAFANPIKAENLSSKNIVAYDACPYCLTEIQLKESPVVVEEKQKVGMEENDDRQLSIPSREKELTKQPTGTRECAKYFGYLSKRSPKEKMPEECITCEKIVQCMLKNITG